MLEIFTAEEGVGKSVIDHILAGVEFQLVDAGDEFFLAYEAAFFNSFSNGIPDGVYHFFGLLQIFLAGRAFNEHFPG